MLKHQFPSVSSSPEQTQKAFGIMLLVLLPRGPTADCKSIGAFFLKS